MKYTVVWTEAAERRLTQLWLSSRMRHAIRDAADQIDILLEGNPAECGESRDRGQRMLLLPPLGVLFEYCPFGSSERFSLNRAPWVRRLEPAAEPRGQLVELPFEVGQQHLGACAADELRIEGGRATAHRCKRLGRPL